VIPLFQKPTQLGYRNTITGVQDNPTQGRLHLEHRGLELPPFLIRQRVAAGLGGTARLETGAVIAFIGRRLLVAIPVVLLGTMAVFALVSARGDPLADLRHRAGVSQADAADLEREYHLDESRPAQTFGWLGDFGAGRLGQVVPNPAGRHLHGGGGHLELRPPGRDRAAVCRWQWRCWWVW